MELRAGRRAAAAAVIVVAAVAGVLTVHRTLPLRGAEGRQGGVRHARAEPPVWTAWGATARSPAFGDEQGPVRLGRLVLTATGFDAAGRVGAYDAASGRRRWWYRTGDSAFIRAVSRRLVLAGPERGELVGLDPSTGRRRWRVRLPTGQSTVAATLSGGRAYVGASFTSEGDLRPPVVRALDAATGRLRWRAVLDRGTNLQWGAPLLAGGLVLVATTPTYLDSAKGHALHALDAATGRRRWRAGLHNREPGFHTERPLLHRGLVIVRGAGSLLAFDPATGRQVWRTRLDGDGPQVLGSAGPLVLAVVSHDLVAVGAGDGRERWRFPLPADDRQWVALGGGQVVALAGGLVIAVDPATGAELWRSWAGPSAGPPLWAAGRIYLATTDRLVALEAASGEGAWVGDRQRLTGGLVAAGGRVLVTTGAGDLLGYAP